MKEQQNNRRSNVRIEVNGRAMTLTQAADLSGLAVHLVRDRIKSGWPLAMALVLPSYSRRH